MRSPDFSDLAPATPPPAGYSPERAAIAQRANAMLAEHAAISDHRVYATRNGAKSRAALMISILVQGGERKRWELGERTRRAEGGYQWFVVLESTSPNGGDADG